MQCSSGQLAEIDPINLQVAAELKGLKPVGRPLLQGHTISPDGQLVTACDAVRKPKCKHTSIKGIEAVGL